MRRSTFVSRQAREVLTRLPRLEPPIDVGAIARRFAVVSEQEMDDDISGMLIPLARSIARKQWIIVVNRDHPPNRKRFTIAHELGHLVLHGFNSPHADRGFLIRRRSNRASDGTVAEEIEANQFAAELLMPEDLIVEHFLARKAEYVSVDADDDETIAELAREFKVSQQALSIRLSNLFL